MSRVAVVVLNFNGRPFLDACLASVRHSTVPADIVIADNGSSDGSPCYVRERYPDVYTVELGSNLGFAGGYNRALAGLPHDWYVLLNNDARLAPTWIESLLAAAERESRAAILGGKLLFDRADAGERRIQSAGACLTDAGTAFEVGWGEPDQGQYDRPRPVGSVPGAAMLVKRSVFQRLGGFDPAYFAYLEDVDLCWRAWLAGEETHYVPEAVAYHHFGASGGGRASPFRIQWMQRNRLANMVKLLESGSWPKGLAVSLAYDAYRIVEFASRGQWRGVRALWAGTLAFCRSWRALWAQRAAIQTTRRMTDRALRERGLLVSATTALREYRRLGRIKVSWNLT